MIKRIAQILPGVFFLLSFQLAAQEQSTFFLSADSIKKHERLFITANWKYHPGDDSAWARPELNDSAWETVVSTQLLPDNFSKNGIGWFRLHLHVDSTLWEMPLALHLYHDGASEIYLDGKRLYQFGSVGSSKKDERGFSTGTNVIFPPKFILFGKRSNHLIAVRYSNFILKDLLETGKLGFNMAVGDLNRWTTLSADNTRFRASLQAVVTAVPAVFAILHLLLFAFYPRLKANLYFAIFTASLFMIGFAVHEEVFGFLTDTQNVIYLIHFVRVLLIAMCLAGLRFLYSLFYPALPKPFWVFTALGIGLTVWSWYSGLDTFVFPIMLLFTILEMLRVVLLAVLRKKDGAWMIGLGFLAFIITGAVLGLFLTGILPQKAIFPASFWFFGVFGVLLSMSIYLGRLFANINKSLEAEMGKTIQLKVENARQEMELQKAAELKAAYQELDAAHTDLKATQQQLVTQEKLASLGQLTAGIAHEIKNPLNFVNNFAALSVDLAKELREELVKRKAKNVNDDFTDVEEILDTLEQNAEKINHHGKRADGIVKSMMQHARGSSGQREMADINHLLDEAVNLTYHGMRANDASFNITIEKEYDSALGKIEVVPQDLSRVFLNMVNNACYAAFQKQNAKSKEQKEIEKNFSPTISVRTKSFGDKIEIRIRDNGNGIPKDIREKIFTPFFTTKPTGQGTGLGLSISHDIIVQQHRGEIKVETEEGKFTEFVVRLPKK